MPNITTRPPLSYTPEQVVAIIPLYNQGNQQQNPTNISQATPNNYTNTGAINNETEVVPIDLQKRTKKAVTTIAKLFKNQKLETKKAEIADMSLLTRNQIEDEIQLALNKKYSKAPSFLYRTDKINDLHILLEKVNTVINNESNNDSANQSYIDGLQDLASTLTYVLKLRSR